jgi:IclR family transcriptional regulator, acetate operon repressor
VSSPAPSRDAPTYPIGSVDSALRLLLLIGERSQVRIADASNELGVARSTAHRLMQMLQFYGFVRQDETTRAYTAGPVWVNLGLQGVRNLDIRTIARPHLEALVADVKETVQLLGLQTGDQLICLDAIESPYVVRAAGRLGVTLPVHATAGGRAVLSSFTPERLRDLFPKPRLERVGTSPMLTRAALETELEHIRERGYAAQRDEVEPGMSAIAAPIRDARGAANFAVDIVMPTTRLSEKDLPRMGAAAIACADAIAAELSW